MWAFEGTGNNVRCQVRANGSFSIYGTLGSQDCRPEAGARLGIHDLVKTIHSLNFNIYTSDSEEHEIDGVGWGLLRNFRAKPTRSHAMISSYPKDDQSESMIGVTVILCERSVERVLNMYKQLFGRADLHHGIIVDFLGFAAQPSSESNLPSFAEFTDLDIMRRKPYLTDSVSFYFYSEMSKPESNHGPATAQAQEVKDALTAIRREAQKFGRWIGIAVTIIAVIAVLLYLRH
jgi:hypothetical protein